MVRISGIVCLCVVTSFCVFMAPGMAQADDVPIAGRWRGSVTTTMRIWGYYQVGVYSPREVQKDVVDRVLLEFPEPLGIGDSSNVSFLFGRFAGREAVPCKYDRATKTFTVEDVDVFSEGIEEDARVIERRLIVQGTFQHARGRWMVEGSVELSHTNAKTKQVTMDVRGTWTATREPDEYKGEGDFYFIEIEGPGPVYVGTSEDAELLRLEGAGELTLRHLEQRIEPPAWVSTALANLESDGIKAGSATLDELTAMVHAPGGRSAHNQRALERLLLYFEAAPHLTYRPVGEQYPLRFGETLQTGDCTVRIRRARDNAVSIFSPGTTVTLRPPPPPVPQKDMYWRLWQGILDFYGTPAERGFQVETRRAIVGIEGTEFSVEHRLGVSTIRVRSGEVEVEDHETGEKTVLKAGETATFGPKGSTLTFDPPDDPGPADPPRADPPATQPPAARMTLRADSRKARTGETVTVPMWLLKGKGLIDLNFNVEYDPAVVQPVGSVVRGNLLPGADFEANTAKRGVVQLGLVPKADGVGAADGTLAQVSFRAVGKPGTRSALRIVPRKGTVAGGAAANPATIHGEIQIVGDDGFIPGDINGDGKTDMADVLMALKISVELLPHNPRADVDGDGQVTAADARLIREMVLGRR